MSNVPGREGQGEFYHARAPPQRSFSTILAGTASPRHCPPLARITPDTSAVSSVGPAPSCPGGLWHGRSYTHTCGGSGPLWGVTGWRTGARSLALEPSGSPHPWDTPPCSRPQLSPRPSSKKGTQSRGGAFAERVWKSQPGCQEWGTVAAAGGPTLTCPFPRGQEGSAGPGTKPGAFASFSTHSPELGPVLSLNLLSWSCQESSAGGVGASAFLL